MHYTLRGRIAKAHPYQLDKTLTVEGAGAEASATGEAIRAVDEFARNHASDTSNPHKVSKMQVGLGNVDNTADIDKPVSIAQAQAINDAKKAGTDAQIAADNAQEAADNAQTAADNAMAAAEKSLTDSKEYINALTLHTGFTIPASGWTSTAPYRQTIDVEGIQEGDDPHVYPLYSDDLNTAMDQKEAIAMVSRGTTEEGKITFLCFEDKPAIDIPVRIEVNR